MYELLLLGGISVSNFKKEEKKTKKGTEKGPHYGFNKYNTIELPPRATGSPWKSNISSGKMFLGISVLQLKPSGGGTFEPGLSQPI